MRFYVPTALMLLMSTTSSWATSWFVNNNGGLDANNGTSTSTPFLTLAKARAVKVAGDTIFVNAGSGPYGGNLFYGPADSGSAGLPVTFQGMTTSWALPNANATNGPVILAASGQPGVQINANYFAFQGFNVQSTVPNSLTAANGIVFGAVNTACSIVYHHITAFGNTISNFPGAGLESVCADYVTFTGNHVTGNANFATAGQSGISIYSSQNFDASTAVKTIVSGNLVDHNVELVNEPACGNHICDGEGIIIDANSGVQTNGVQYTGMTQVTNNAVWDNGSNCVEIGNSSHAQVWYNTCLQNGTSLVNPGEITVRSSAGDVDVENNIMQSLPGGVTEFTSNNTTTLGPIKYDYNLLFVGSSTVSGSHDSTGDPQFVSPPTNLMLNLSSPAFGIGNPAITLPTDLMGTPRPLNCVYAIGAYQI